MKVVVLYRSQSEHGTQVESFLREFQSRGSYKVETMDPDSREGMELARVYDIVAYPAILAMQDDGQLMKFWQGGELPLMDELASYARA